MTGAVDMPDAVDMCSAVDMRSTVDGPRTADVPRTADAPGAVRVRCVAHVHVDTRRIRALFGGEKPPVPGDEWDEAEYVAQRMRDYRDTLDAIADVRAMRPGHGDDLAACDGGHLAARDGDDSAPRGDGPTARSDDSAPRGDERSQASYCTSASCPRTGDRVRIELGEVDAPERDALRADAERALQRVFADAHAWRRHLLPAYFERHRSWRAVAGAPIQH